jgi:hypothetical protein
VWTFIILFIISGVEGVQNLIPADMLTPIEFALTLLGTYFRVNPRV